MIKTALRFTHGYDEISKVNCSVQQVAILQKKIACGLPAFINGIHRQRGAA